MAVRNIVSVTSRLPVVALLLSLTILAGCRGDYCFGNHFCTGDDFEVVNRGINSRGTEYTIEGEIDGDLISHTFELYEKENIQALSFGVEDAWTFRSYGGQKKIDILSDHALNTYREKYLIPRKHCPVSFMNQNLRSIVLIAATDSIAAQLEDYDIPFDGEGTKFELSGHYLEHMDDRYIENGEQLNLSIAEHISIISNVGSARRKVEYFLVTDIL